MPAPTPPDAAGWECWTWPDAQERRRASTRGVGRRRQRLLRVTVCRPVSGGREHGSRPPA
ncbi:hypothetical protein [Terrabacter sp. Root85]|uniref:hypothetical protein n=1 Tax=Terrabacter sp. Root85 TaxID=1736603 RepID=UPI000B2570A8|nr:hypothetical protein [Terrabacter sp. Root85]